MLVDLHGGVPTDRFWKWIDPGALALIGAASFFGGVSRLTMSLTVIMVRGAVSRGGCLVWVHFVTQNNTVHVSQQQHTYVLCTIVTLFWINL